MYSELEATNLLKIGMKFGKIHMYIVKPLLNMNLNYPSDIVSIHCGILASKAQA